ncbi:MAG TPA: hypothetical protein EYP04_08660 [Anaerolineae bacterium]|nr:hypothetical protein [Anaerolineae bacterium]
MRWIVGLQLAVLLTTGALLATPPVPISRAQSFGPRFGINIAYGVGGKEALDAFGNIWYTDYSFSPPTWAGHARLYMVRPGSARANWAAVMRADRGAWWAVGNEPNDPYQDHQTPEAYAVFYHDFVLAARAVDPSVRLIPAGVANADWQWAEAFRQAHWERYGYWPVLDGWNIHNYLLEDDVDPYDVGEFQQRIVAFRDWMARIGDANKPLFLSEFGVLYGNGCCGRPVDPPEWTVDFMQQTVQWLATTDYVQYWAWFASNTRGQYNGDLFDDEGRLTVYGRAYRALIRQFDGISGV